MSENLVSILVILGFCIGFAWGRVWQRVESAIINCLNGMANALNRFTRKQP